MNRLLRQLDSCYLIVSKEEAIGAISYIQYRKKKKKSKKKRGRVVFLKCMIFFFYCPLQSMTYPTNEKQQTLHAADFKIVGKSAGSVIIEFTKAVIKEPIDINDPKAAQQFAKLIKVCVSSTQEHYKPKTTVDLGGITVVNPKAS